MSVTPDTPVSPPPRAAALSDDRRLPRWAVPTLLAVVVAVLGTMAFLFVFRRLTGLIGVLVISLFVSFALEPAVNWLARRGWKRGLATGAVMLVTVLLAIAFVALMVPLVAEQVRALIQNIPEWVNHVNPTLDRWFHVKIATSSADAQSQKLMDAITGVGTRMAGNVLGIAVGFVGTIFQVFTIGLFSFYLIAEGPRVRRTMLSLMPSERQHDVLRVWEVAIDKTGGYLYSRLLLALISGVCHFIVLTSLRVPFAVPLALWMGLVSQFIPTVGTYIAAAIPLLVAVLDAPWKALVLLGFIIVYQQIENMSFAPRVTAHTMDMHAAVAFGSVIAGAALFGPLGAVLAIPGVAILQAVIWTSLSRYQVVDDDLTSDFPGTAKEESA
jgi:predicted PurR-regulated permease PerM